LGQKALRLTPFTDTNHLPEAGNFAYPIFEKAIQEEKYNLNP
jgi:hypothetical protein